MGPVNSLGNVNSHSNLDGNILATVRMYKTTGSWFPTMYSFYTYDGYVVGGSGSGWGLLIVGIIAYIEMTQSANVNMYFLYSNRIYYRDANMISHTGDWVKIVG